MSVDFVAVDFETWNSNPDSMCQFGLVKVKDGKVVDSLCRYVRPLIVAGPSSKMMVKKNGGIDEDTVAGEEPFGRLFEDFIRFCGRMPLVAHNASFDRRVLKQTCWGFDLPIPHYKWYDTLYLSRAFNEMTPGGNKLDEVANSLGLPDFDHHHADADARACAGIVIEYARRNNCDCLDGLVRLAPSFECPHDTPDGDGFDKWAHDFQTKLLRDFLRLNRCGKMPIRGTHRLQTCSDCLSEGIFHDCTSHTIIHALSATILMIHVGMRTPYRSPRPSASRRRTARSRST